METASATELSRMRWRCRRGMKELDVLLENYLLNQYAKAAADEREAFRHLLELPDPELAGFILGRTQPEQSAMSHVIKRIRAAD